MPCLVDVDVTRRVAFYPNASATFNPSILVLKLSGDIHPLPGPIARNHNSTQTIIHLAKCSQSKQQTPLDFQAMANSKDLDVVIFTEIWLAPTVLDKEILPRGYGIYRRDRLGNIEEEGGFSRHKIRHPKQTPSSSGVS